jgi:hypothetical protein
MSPAAILFATLRFCAWEAALFGVAILLARRLGWKLADAEGWLAVLAIEITLESSIAGLFSFARMNSPAAYWTVAAVCAAGAVLWGRLEPAHPRAGSCLPHMGWKAGAIAALAAPLALLSFRGVEEIDSINYLHYLLDWMANRATPYVFATNYVAFWELSFLPAWITTRLDLFFPLIALKGVLLLGLAAWLAGRELGLRNGLLLWTVCGSLALRHLWFGYSGVPTLKNDAMHGAGFALLALAVMRAARGENRPRDMALLAFGAAFASVKYTGIFVAVIAFAAALWLRWRREDSNAGSEAGMASRRLAPQSVAALGLGLAFVLLTSGHYYLHNLLLWGSPFYPFQINFGPIHLPGTADLSSTSILYSLRDARLWRAFFLPPGTSPAGLLFPLTLTAGLAAAAWRSGGAAIRLFRTKDPADWAALAILCGWLLYFRAVYSASASPGDLKFVLNGLNSIRYVEGVLALTELFLAALLARRSMRLALAFAILNTATRLAAAYAEMPLNVFPWTVVCAVAAGAFVLASGLARLRPARFALAAALCLTAACPFVVQRNGAFWTACWDDLKPALAARRGAGLAVLAMPETGYFAGHAFAAGNPVDPAVKSLLKEEVEAMPAADRPRRLAVLPTPDAPPEWFERHGTDLARWGYKVVERGSHGVIFER